MDITEKQILVEFIFDNEINSASIEEIESKYNVNIKIIKDKYYKRIMVITYEGYSERFILEY